MARLADIVFDCEKPAPLGRWWASTLDGYRVAPYDAAEVERLRTLGVIDLEDDPSVVVEPTSGGEPRYLFMQVPRTEAAREPSCTWTCAAMNWRLRSPGSSRAVPSSSTEPTPT